MTCQTDGTQTLDTGHQIAASNVSFDDERIGSGCPHVQCALDLVYETQQQHLADFENPHEVNIDQIPHILSDHTDVSAVAPLDGQVLTSQGGVYVPSNPVTGVTDHLLLSNIGTNTHDVIDAHLADLSQNPHMITPAMIGAEPENANIQAHIADVTTNPHQVTYEQLGGTAPFTGFKNVLINGDFRVNQRGFDGNWIGDDWGYDRWRGSVSEPAMVSQPVESVNMVDGQEYVYSWDTPLDEGVIKQLNSSTEIIRGLSPLVFTFNSAQPIQVYRPKTATNVQLELGSVQTNVEVRNIQQELAMCQRFYNPLIPVSMPYDEYKASSSWWVYDKIPYPAMRAIPNVAFSFSGVTNAQAYAVTANDGFIEVRAQSIAAGRMLFTVDQITLDAEL